MGKIIKTVTADAESYRADWAYRSINSTHADVVVTDNYGAPVAIIEYHDGSDREGTSKRDQVKSIARGFVSLNCSRTWTGTRDNGSSPRHSRHTDHALAWVKAAAIQASFIQIGSPFRLNISTNLPCRMSQGGPGGMAWALRRLWDLIHHKLVRDAVQRCALRHRLEVTHLKD